MSQFASIILGSTSIQVIIPPSEEDVLPGITWGAVDAFPTPAYWLYQVLSHRLCQNISSHRIGNSFIEEVGACLLGGHGIPAKVGLAAFFKLQSEGIFTSTPSEKDIFNLLSQPLTIEGKEIKYRFAKQKSYYLGEAIRILSTEKIPLSSGKILRNWLLRIPGIGYKTASWIARNWLNADDVAILDIHIIRAGILGNFLNENLSVQRHYLELENQFICFANAMNVRASELDAVIWYEMMSSSRTVAKLFEQRNTRSSLRRTNKSHSNSTQEVPVN